MPVLAFLAALFFAAAVLVHGGLASIHSHWFGWEGLMLLGFLCWALEVFVPGARSLWRRAADRRPADS